MLSFLHKTTLWNRRKVKTNITRRRQENSTIWMVCSNGFNLTLCIKAQPTLFLTTYFTSVSFQQGWKNTLSLHLHVQCSVKIWAGASLMLAKMIAGYMIVSISRLFWFMHISCTKFALSSLTSQSVFRGWCRLVADKVLNWDKCDTKTELNAALNHLSLLFWSSTIPVEVCEV